MTRHGLLIAAILLLPACAGDGGSSSILGDDSFLGGNTSNPQQVVLPNQVSGGNRGGVAPGSREAIAAAQNQNTQLTQAQRAARLKRAEQLWCRANQLEKARNWSAAGDLYEKIVEDYPEYPQAAEAQFRAGKMSFERRAYRLAMLKLSDYMGFAPVNPHLPEVEEMLYLSAKRLLADTGGFWDIFKDPAEAIRGLEYVTTSFPAGQYADDALMDLARYYHKEGSEEDLTNAVLAYKELLIRYPDSEWSFEARLGLADAYRDRDQGNPYHAGYVDLDPRETYANAQAETFGAEVRSSPKKALEQYDAFLERMDLDPVRCGEYSRQVAYARQQSAVMREKLAAKDLRTANWYLGKGDRQGARTYFEYAAAYSDTASGQRAAVQLRALCGGNDALAPKGTAPRTTGPYVNETRPSGAVRPATPDRRTRSVPQPGPGVQGVPPGSGMNPPRPPPPSMMPPPPSTSRPIAYSTPGSSTPRVVSAPSRGSSTAPPPPPPPPPMPMGPGR